MDVSYLLYPIFYKWGHSLNVRKFASLMSNIKKLLFLLRTIRINLRCLPGLRWIAQIFLWNVPILHDACISLRYHSVLMVFYWVPEREDGNELRKKGQSYTHLWYGYTQDINITERLPLPKSDPFGWRSYPWAFFYSSQDRFILYFFWFPF